MDGDYQDNLMERILQDLKNVLVNDPLIDEFDILPVNESTQNKSPVIHVMNKLGLENWCVKQLYAYAYNKFFVWRNKKLKCDTESVLKWTCAILLINPEIETVWNARKELFCNSISPSKDKSQLKDELKFSELVLSRKPKSSAVFAHRKWALLKMKEKFIFPEIIKQEYFVCLRMANLYPNNYYAWSHRSWIMDEILHTCLKSVSEELSSTELWVSTHISDHSGFHYRQFLLSCYRTLPANKIKSASCSLHETSPYVLEEESASCYSISGDKSPLYKWFEAINQEITFLTNLQNAYPGHETLWYHRRFLLRETHLAATGVDVGFKGLCSTKLTSLDDSIQNKRLKSEWDFDEKWDLNKEEDFLKHCYNASVNNNWERTMLSRHVKWLSNVLNWQLSISVS